MKNRNLVDMITASQFDGEALKDFLREMVEKAMLYSLYKIYLKQHGVDAKDTIFDMLDEAAALPFINEAVNSGKITEDQNSKYLDCLNDVQDEFLKLLK